ncbi:MAG: protein kinase domain-containing protein [Gammaproteobacteria bacterium]
MANERPKNALPEDHELLWYRFLEVLGAGGFGITYLGRDQNLDQKVAIKEYLPSEFSFRSDDSTVHPTSSSHQATFEWGLKRFIEEARTLAKFTHPNIVRVLSVFESQNTAYMVMAYEAGEELGQRLKAGRNHSEEELLAIVLPILDGLTAVHEAGFIHRDIKPANIFIRSDGSPVLLDFGSARQALGGQTRTLTSVVTPGYAPFEQYDDAGGKQGPYTDIYALAATLYRAVVGRPPPNALSRATALMGRNPDPLIPVSEKHRDEYSASFLAAIDHGLRFHAQDRPQDCAQWRRELTGETPAPTPTREGVSGATPAAPQDAADTRLDDTATALTEASGTARDDEAPTEPGTTPDFVRARATGPQRSAKPLVLAGIAALLIGGGALFMFGGGTPSPTDVPPSATSMTPTPTPTPTPRTETETETTSATGADPASSPAESQTENLTETVADSVTASDGPEPGLSGDDGTAGDPAPTLPPQAQPKELNEPERLDAQRSAAPVSAMDTPEVAAANSGQTTNAASAPSAGDAAATAQAQAQAQAQRDTEAEAAARKAQQEARIGTLLAEAQSLNRAGAPENELRQAMGLYNEVLGIEPKHPDANSGLERARQALTDTLVRTEKVRVALAQAAAAVEAKRYTTPEGASARDHFIRALELDPDNTEAKQGLTELVNRYTALARSAGERENFDQALAFVARGLSIDADAPALLTLREDLNNRIAARERAATEQQEREQAARDRARRESEARVQTLLARAQAQLLAGQLDSPPGDNARETYTAILKLDPANAPARAGLESITATRAERDRAVSATPDKTSPAARQIALFPFSEGSGYGGSGYNAELTRALGDAVSSAARRWLDTRKGTPTPSLTLRENRRAVGNRDSGAFESLCASSQADFVWTVNMVRPVGGLGDMDMESALHECATGKRRDISTPLPPGSDGKRHPERRAVAFLEDNQDLLGSAPTTAQAAATVRLLLLAEPGGKSSETRTEYSQRLMKSTARTASDWLSSSGISPTPVLQRETIGRVINNDDDSAFDALCAEHPDDFVWSVMVLRAFEKGVKQFDSALHHCPSGKRATESKRISKNPQGKFTVDLHALRFLQGQYSLLER